MESKAGKTKGTGKSKRKRSPKNEHLDAVPSFLAFTFGWGRFNAKTEEREKRRRKNRDKSHSLELILPDIADPKF